MFCPKQSERLDPVHRSFHPVTGRLQNGFSSIREVIESSATRIDLVSTFDGFAAAATRADAPAVFRAIGQVGHVENGRDPAGTEHRTAAILRTRDRGFIMV